MIFGENQLKMLMFKIFEISLLWRQLHQDSRNLDPDERLYSQKLSHRDEYRAYMRQDLFHNGTLWSHQTISLEIFRINNLETTLHSRSPLWPVATSELVTTGRNWSRLAAQKKSWFWISKSYFESFIGYLRRSRVPEFVRFSHSLY